MEEISNIQLRREFGDCFYVDIPLEGSMEEIKQRISNATSIEETVKTMLDGDMSLEDMVEEIEPTLLDMGVSVDSYLEVAEDNMEYTLLHLPHSYG